MQLSVIIPAYNEEKRIAITLEEISQYLDEKNFEYEIIVVNDGSKDKTSEIAGQFKSKIKNLKIISYEKNRGKGFAVRQGLMAAEGRYKLFMDADNSTPIAEFEKFLPYLNTHDIIIGSRSIEGSEIVVAQPKYRVFLGKLFNVLIKLIIGLKDIPDTQCGFKLLSAEAVENIMPKCKINGWAFDVEILVIAKKLGYKIKEIPITWTNNKNSALKLKGMFAALVDLFRIKNCLPIYIIIILAVLTRFALLGYPNEIVFDEVYYLESASQYFNGEYYFTAHPPLAIMLLAESAKLLGFNPNSLKGNVLALRFLPAVIGTLFIILIYKIILALGLEKKIAFLVGFLLIFDGSFLISSRFALSDIFLLFFGFTSFYFFVLYARREEKSGGYLLALSAFFAGIAASVKWTGASFAAIVFFYFIYKLLLDRKTVFNVLQKSAFFLSIFILTYFLVFFISFNALYKYQPQSTLLEKFYEVNNNIYKYHSGLKASHPYSSKWYQWLVMEKPIWYWSENSANIYFTGNPASWMFVLVFFPLSVINSLKNRFSLFGLIVTAAYFINIIPFFAISRVVFLYHYMPALTFGLIGGAIYYNKYLNSKKYLPLYFSILILSALFFILLMPIYYGL